MRRGAAVIFGFGLASLGACSTDLALDLRPGEPAQLYELRTGNARVLHPESESYRKLVQWVAANRHGWSRDFAIPPAQGVIVRCGKVELQFTESRALAQTSNGVFSKPASPGEFSFLTESLLEELALGSDPTF